MSKAWYRSFIGVFSIWQFFAIFIYLLSSAEDDSISLFQAEAGVFVLGVILFLITKFFDWAFID